MSGVLEPNEKDELRSRLLYFAGRWYGMANDVAEDIAQDALLTFIQVRDRYPDPAEHRAILVGIFRNKCREYIAKDVRAVRGLKALRSATEAGDPKVASKPTLASRDDGILHDLVHRENGGIILEALSSLRPKAREMFRLILEEGCSRAELVERMGLNRNTLDSRLHAYRAELRDILARRGVHI